MRIVAALATTIASLPVLSGCGDTSPAGPHAATLAPDSVGDTTLHFRTDRTPVFAPGRECDAFTPQLDKIPGVPQGVRASAMVPGHGCWATGADGTTLSVLTTATPFGEFWRRNYPDDDGTGITATTVDEHFAQLFDRFLIDHRYYAIRAGSRWAAGLDSGATKSACMLVVDTGSRQPLLINTTQQVTGSDPDVRTPAQQCGLAEQVAHTILIEHDPGGGSRVS